MYNAKLTQDELHAIKERAEKATPGPWVWEDEYTGLMLRSHRNHDVEEGYYGKEVVEAGCSQNTGDIAVEDKDKEFIAASRQDIPRLVAEVERLRNHNHALTVKIDTIRGHIDDKDDEIARLRKHIESALFYIENDGNFRDIYDELKEALE